MTIVLKQAGQRIILDMPRLQKLLGSECLHHGSVASNHCFMTLSHIKVITPAIVCMCSFTG